MSRPAYFDEQAKDIYNRLVGMGQTVFAYDENGNLLDENWQKAMAFWSKPLNMMVTLGYTQGRPPKPQVEINTSASTDMNQVMEIMHSLHSHNPRDFSVNLRQFGRELDPTHFKHLKKMDNLMEMQWTGSTRTSRWKTGLTEVVIRHMHRISPDVTQPRRWCNIKDIFIHGGDGSRYKCDFRHVLGAKALAQHMNHAGAPWDSAGQNLLHVIHTLMDLRKLKRWALNLNDDHMLQTIQDLQANIKSQLKKMLDAENYPDVMNQITNQVQSWRETQPVPGYDWPADSQKGAQAVSAHLMQVHDAAPQTQPALTSIPELDALLEWLQEDQNTTQDDVSQAHAATNSTDPVQIFKHLRNNVTGWEAEFEQDPKAVMDDITQVLNQIKKLKV